ncbi:hypothetical protein, partial [Vibrio anguillarum]|uniref:hypothetical protein n=1 Tax=Vibrio anguillarum TaxID=55601 RepID=UPI001BE4279F
LPTTQNEWPEKSQKIEPLNLPELHNAQLRCEPRYHNTQIGRRKHRTQPKPKMPSVVNHS